MDGKSLRRLCSGDLGIIARLGSQEAAGGGAWGWIEGVGESFLMVIKKLYVWSRITRTILLRGVISSGLQAVISSLRDGGDLD